CADNGAVKGFLAAGTPEFNRARPLPAATIARFPDVSYEGSPLTDWRCCICGPVAIDSSARGTGAFEGMYRELFRILSQDYELAVTLVSVDNGRSLHAHEKVGYERVDNFTYNSREFIILVRKIDSAPAL